MSTFLLVHGAWHAGWVWRDVVKLIPKSYATIVVDLPGHGANKADKACITMDDYVRYLLSIIHSIDGKVILVGHSMAGLIISQVAELIPTKIERLVYIAAFIPANGENLVDIAKIFRQRGISPEMVWNNQLKVIELRKNEATKNIFFNACPKAEADWALSMLESEPMQPYFDQLSLSSENFGSVEKHLILCAQDKAICFEDQLDLANKISGITTTLTTADHSPFLSSPLALVEALMHLSDESNTSKVLNRLSNAINQCYGYVTVAGDNFGEPAINSGPCAPFANAFLKIWNRKFKQHVHIAFIMIKNSDECWHVVVRLPNGLLFDGGFGVHNEARYKGQFDIVDMETYDPELLERLSGGLNRTYPRYCPNFSVDTISQLIEEHLATSLIEEFNS